MNRKTILLVCLGISLLGAGLGADGPSLRVAAASPASAVSLQLEMRALWEDHITFTRNYIISALAGLQDKDAVAARLLRNQDEIGSALEPYYGRPFADRFASLLRAHITIAAEVVATAQAGDQEGLKRAQAKWSANGAEISSSLSKANPYWSREVVADMLRDHLALTTQEVSARLSQDWKGDIENYDELHAHMLMFADFLALGVSKQFPKKLDAASLDGVGEKRHPWTLDVGDESAPFMAEPARSGAGLTRFVRL
jgi:hypothetical protein